MKRRERKRRARAERWYRKNRRALCSSDLFPSLEGAPDWVGMKKVRRKGGDGREAALLAARANGSWAVQRRSTRGFMAWAGECCGGR